VFTAALDRELEKIRKFYQEKEEEAYSELEGLLKDEEDFEAEHGDLDLEASWASAQTRPGNRRGSILRSSWLSGGRRRASMPPTDGQADEGSDDDADETSALNRRKSISSARSQEQEDMHGSRMTRSRASIGGFDDFADQAFAAIYNSSVTLKKRTISLYVTLCELRSFLQLNRTGFQKVLKKYDKTLDRHLKSFYIERHVANAHPFKQETMSKLGDCVQRMETLYAKIATKGDLAQAKRDLRLHLREHVVWERNTVWREMIGIERKAQAANLGIRGTVLGQDDDPSKARLQGDADATELKEVDTPIGKYRCPTWLFNTTLYTLIAILAVFFVLLFVPIMSEPEEQNCLALVVFVSLLWATEVSTSPATIQNRCFLTRHRLFHSSFHRYSFRSLPSCCESFEPMMLLISASIPRRRLRTSSLQCGRLSLCFCLEASRLRRRFPSTILQR
jgi:phosphate transporter